MILCAHESKLFAMKTTFYASDVIAWLHSYWEYVQLLFVEDPLCFFVIANYIESGVYFSYNIQYTTSENEIPKTIVFTVLFGKESPL